MKKVLILGAGLSAYVLIDYLLENAEENDWQITVGCRTLSTAERVCKNHPRSRAISFDIENSEQAEEEIKNANLVISMLPARFHPIPAKLCVKYGIHMVTTSYVSEELWKFDAEAKEKDILLLNEVGLDPGIDHMSAMKIIERLKSEGANIVSFRSYTGGLVAPKYDNNPWNYKFTWNPRNVVLAGQGTAKYIVNGDYKYVPYHKLFQQVDKFNVLSYGEFEGYANRDSLQYRSTYGLDNIPTMIRGTLRRTHYCKTYDVFIQLGMTDDTYTIENSENMTYRQFINSFLQYDPEKTVEQKLSKYLNIPEDDYIMYRLRWLGIFDDQKIVGLPNATPAQILQKILEEKWSLDPEDRDLVVMQHIFEYITKSGVKKILKSSLAVEGDETKTAMALTVGMPAALAVKLILQGKMKANGVKIPTIPTIYDPILEELEKIGVIFIEEEE